MDADDIAGELKRLRARGQELTGPPTARQDLLARLLEPHAWAPHAQEHIDWAAKYGRMSPSISFGGQFAGLRTIAQARAATILEALDRQARGEAQVVTLDIRKLTEGLQASSPYDRNGRTARARTITSLAALHHLDGVAMPDVEDDGDTITMTWALRNGTASLRIDGAHTVTAWLRPARTDFQPWRESVYSQRLPALLGDLLRTRSDTDTRKKDMITPSVIPDTLAVAADGAPARLNLHDLGTALEGAITLYDIEYDNDTEALFVTRGGQYVRRTGEDSDRYYVLDRDDARDVADGIIDEDELDLLIP